MLRSPLRSGSIIARVDAHCVLPPGYLARALETLDRTGAANVGGVQHAVGSGTVGRAVAAAMTSRFGVGDARFHYGGDEGPADTAYLGVFDAAVLRSVGGYDESLVRNQDYELNWRLRDAGHLVWFDPGLVVRYHPRERLAALARQYFDYGRWKREMLRRNPRSLRASPADRAGDAPRCRRRAGRCRRRPTLDAGSARRLRHRRPRRDDSRRRRSIRRRVRPWPRCSPPCTAPGARAS